MSVSYAERIDVPYLYLLIVVLVAAAVISLVLSFLGILVVGALKLLPLVFVALILALVVGRLKVGVLHGKRPDDDDDHWLES